MPDKDARQARRGEEFWRFSLALYARPSVAEALLALQDRAGCDVNLVLFALWRGAHQAHCLESAELVAAKASIRRLNAGLIAPLRQLRDELKTAEESDLRRWRRRILAVELAAERQVQQRLAADTGRPRHRTTRFAAATANLALCLGEAAHSAEADTLRQAVAALMRAI